MQASERGWPDPDQQAALWVLASGVFLPSYTDSQSGVCIAVESGDRCQDGGMPVHRGKGQVWGSTMASSSCTATEAWIGCRVYSQTLALGRSRGWEGTQVAGFSECQHSGVKNGENLQDVHRMFLLLLFVCLFCCES